MLRLHQLIVHDIHDLEKALMKSHHSARGARLEEKVTTVALVMISSFAIALVPLVYGMQATDADGEVIVPVEAWLWLDALGKGDES